jgi:hypothetical protein
LFVALPQTKTMKKLILTLVLLYTVVTGSNGHPSWGIVVDKHQNIYFADIAHNEMGSVWKLTKEGKLELLLGNFHAHNVSLDKNGNIITAHGENTHTMIRLNTDGSIDTLFNTKNHKNFFGGNCTYSIGGEIIFGIEKYLWRIDDSGQRQKVSTYKFEKNQSVYCDKEGNTYGPNIEAGNGKVVKIDSQGNAVVIGENLITKLDRDYDPHQDALLGIVKNGNHIYIAETAGQRIIKISENGQSETFYKSKGTWFPSGIDFFSNDAYILEYNFTGGIKGPRITKVDQLGNATVVFDFETYQKPAESSKSKEKTAKFSWVYLFASLFGIAAILVVLKFIL